MARGKAIESVEVLDQEANRYVQFHYELMDCRQKRQVTLGPQQVGGGLNTWRKALTGNSAIGL